MAFRHGRWTGPLRGADHCPVLSTACGACHHPALGQGEFGTATHSNAAKRTSCIVTALPYDHRGLDLWAQAHCAHSRQNAQSIKLSRLPSRQEQSAPDETTDSYYRWETMAFHKAERERDILDLNSCCISEQAGRPLLWAAHNSSSFPIPVSPS